MTWLVLRPIAKAELQGICVLVVQVIQVMTATDDAEIVAETLVGGVKQGGKFGPRYGLGARSIGKPAVYSFGMGVTDIFFKEKVLG